MKANMFKTRIFVSIVAAVLLFSFSGCNVVRLFNSDQSQTDEQQEEQQDSKKATLDAPTKPVTLDGDLAKIIVGVWDLDHLSGSKEWTREGYLNIVENSQNRTFTWIFKADGTFEIDIFGRKISGTWEITGENAVMLTDSDGDKHECTYDRDTHLLFYESGYVTHIRKISDDPSDLSDMMYVDGKFNSFSVWLPGSYSIVSIDYADPNEIDLDKKGVDEAAAGSGLSYHMSIRTNGNVAFYALGKAYRMQIAIDRLSEDGKTYPVLLENPNTGEFVEAGTISADPDNEGDFVILKLPEYTITFALMSHMSDVWPDTVYPPKVGNPWDEVSDSQKGDSQEGVSGSHTDSGSKSAH